MFRAAHTDVVGHRQVMEMNERLAQVKADVAAYEQAQE